MSSVLPRLCLTTLIPFALMACEPIEPSANIFEPRAVTTNSPAADPTSAVEAPAGPEWDFADDADFVIGSDEMGTDADANADAEGDGTDTEAEAAEAIAPVEGDEPDTDSAATATAISPSPATAPTEADGAQGDGWPLRLVSTVHQAQPPRAILGLPDGRELVVTPGDILAEERLVILAIGEGIIQVAEISPNGDHAEIASRTLTSQY